MKTVRYQFEQVLQQAKPENTDWLKEEFSSILESERDHTRKADYIGFSLLSFDHSIQSIDEEIKELQQLKKRLKEARELALTTGAEVFTQYGIDKLDGAGISSITLTRATTVNKTKLIIENPEALIEAGFYKKVLDEEMIRDLYDNPKYREIIHQYARLEHESVPRPAKLRVNKRRGVNTTDYTGIEKEVRA